MELKTEHQQLAEAITKNENQIRDLQCQVRGIKYALIEITKNLESIVQAISAVTRG